MTARVPPRRERVSERQVVVRGADAFDAAGDQEPTCEATMPPLRPGDIDLVGSATDVDAVLPAATDELSAPDLVAATEHVPATPAGGKTRAPSQLPPELLAAGEPRRYQGEQFLFREGEPGSELFVVRRGRVELIKWERTPRRTRVEVLEAGACFGELALLGDGHRHLSCRALTDVEVLVIGQPKLREAIAATPRIERELRGLYRDRLFEVLLRTSTVFSTMDEEEARACLRRFRPLGLKADQVVVAEGAPAPGLFLVLLGQLRVSCRPSPGAEPVLVAVLADGDIFGEISLLRDQPATATVRTKGFVQLLHLPLDECHRLLAAHPELVEKLEAEAHRRDRVNRAILRGAAFFDEARGVVVYRPAV